MPPRRKGASATHEHRPDDNASNVEDSHGMVRQNRGTRGAGRGINRSGTGGVGKQEEVKELPQGKMATGRCQALSRRGSNVPALGQSTTILPIHVPNTTLKAEKSSLKLTGGLDSLSAHADCTQMATRSEPKLNQALNLRTSTRTRKVVCYNEQSPSHPSNKIPPTDSKPNTKAAAKRSETSALLLSSGAKRVKEDQTSSIGETLALAPETTSHVKRGRPRDQELKPLQSHVDKDSAVFAPATTSTRTREVVCYNEQSPSHPNNKIPPTDSKPNAKAAAKRSETSALLLSGGAKRVKEDQTSSIGETLALAPETTSHVKRGRTRDQELKPLQSHVDKDSAVFAPATTSHVKRGRTRDQGLKSLQSHADENSAAGMTSDQILLLQTRSKPPKEKNPDTATKLEALVGKKSVTTTKQEQKCNMEITVNAKAESDYTAHTQIKKRISKKVTRAPQEQEMADESTGLESQVMPAADGNGQDLPTSEVVDEMSIQVHKLVDGSKHKITVKEIKRFSRQISMGNAAQNSEVCLPDAFHVEPKEVGDIAQSTDSGKKICSKAQKKGRKTVSLKRTLPEAQVRKEGDTYAGIVTDRDLLLDCKSAEKGGVQESIIVDKNLRSQTQVKGIKTVKRKRTSFGTKGDEMENATIIETAEIEISHDGKLDLKSSEKGGVQESNLQCQTRGKGRKTVTRKRTSPTTRGDEMENATVLEMPSLLAINDHGTITDTKPEEVSGSYESSKADNKHYVETQQKEKKAASRKRTCTTKRTVLGSAQHAKKLKISGSLCPDTQHSANPEPLMQKLVQEAESQECNKAIQGVDTQDWTAADLTNFGSKVEGSSERKRKEEGKRKRAMKFDALPVGFGLGISCWSPSPPKCQGLELQEVTGLSEVGDSVVDNQAHLIYSLGEAEKRPHRQEVAMLEDTSNIVSRKKDVNVQPINVYAILSSATELHESSISQNDAKKVRGIGLGSTPDKSAKFQGGKVKVKVKREVGDKTKKTNALLVASPQSVAESSGDKKFESGIDGLKTKMQLSSGKGAATRSKRITRRTKR